MLSLFLSMVAASGVGAWQLPETTTLARTTYWIGYMLHQLLVWALLITVRIRTDRGESTRSLNAGVMGVNLLFVGLHLVQTWFWYDGLAYVVATGSYFDKKSSLLGKFR